VGTPDCEEPIWYEPIATFSSTIRNSTSPSSQISISALSKPEPSAVCTASCGDRESITFETTRSEWWCASPPGLPCTFSTQFMLFATPVPTERTSIHFS
jgi:hypothetical protein